MLIDNLMVLNPSLCSSIHKKSWNFLPSYRVKESLGSRNKRVLRLVVPNAKKKKGFNSRKRSWLARFFSEEDGNWLGLKEEDLDEGDDDDEEDDDEEKFEAWKKRAEAIIELREAQEGIRNEENRNWEDWLVFDKGNGGIKREDWDYDNEDNVKELREEDVAGDADEMMPEKGLVKVIEDLILGKEDDDLLYEDRVFQFASRNSVLVSLDLVIVLGYVL